MSKHTSAVLARFNRARLFPADWDTVEPDMQDHIADLLLSKWQRLGKRSAKDKVTEVVGLLACAFKNFTIELGKDYDRDTGSGELNQESEMLIRQYLEYRLQGVGPYASFPDWLAGEQSYRQGLLFDLKSEK